MGNQSSFFGEEPEKQLKKHKFGGYKNKDNPRPGYFKTPSSVYYRGEEINAIPSSFTKFGKGWAKDKNNVFFKGKIVNNADSKTFRIDNNAFKDKSGKWHQGKLIR